MQNYTNCKKCGNIVTEYEGNGGYICWSCRTDCLVRRAMNFKGLTLTQPWASGMAWGEKKNETRSWQTNYRGWIAIHAAKGMPAYAKRDCIESRLISEALVHNKIDPTKADKQLPRGKILAVAELYAVMPTGGVSIGVDNVTGKEYWWGNYDHGRYYWKFWNMLVLETPVECTGALSLWQLPLNVFGLVQNQLLSARLAY